MDGSRKNEKGGIYYKVVDLDNMGNILAGPSHKTHPDFLEKFSE